MATVKKKTRGAVGIIITTPKRDGVWISKRSENKPGESKWYAGYSQVPGGKIDPGESPRAAAVRELMEETGLFATAPGTKDVIHTDAEVLLPMHCGTFTLPDGRPFDSEHFLMITERKPKHLEKDSSDAWRYVKIGQLHRLQFMPSTLAALSFAIRFEYLQHPDVKPSKSKVDLTEVIKPLKWAPTPGSNSSRVSVNTIGPTYTIIKRGVGHWQLVLSTRVAGDRGDFYPRRDDAIDAANCHFRAVLKKYLKL